MKHNQWSALARAQKWCWIFLVGLAWFLGLSTGLGMWSSNAAVFGLLGLAGLCATLYFVGKPTKQELSELKDKD